MLYYVLMSNGSGISQGAIDKVLEALVDSAKTSPLFVWVALPVVSIFAISLLFPQVLGNFGKGIAAWGDSRRRSSTDRSNWQINDLGGQREYLQKELEDLRRENDELRDDIDSWNHQAQIHTVWDWEARQELIKGDPDYPLPPAIRPRRGSDAE